MAYKKFVCLFNSYYFNVNNNNNIRSFILINNNNNNKDNFINDDVLSNYVNNLTNDIPNNRALHKIKQITYHILNITKLLINNFITKLLITYNIDPIGRIISSLGISGLNFIINELLLSKIYDDLTDDEKNLLLSITNDIKYIYKKSCQFLNSQIIKIMNSSCCNSCC